MYLFSNWLGCDKFLNLKEKKGGNYCLHRVGALKALDTNISSCWDKTVEEWKGDKKYRRVLREIDQTITDNTWGILVTKS